MSLALTHAAGNDDWKSIIRILVSATKCGVRECFSFAEDALKAAAGGGYLKCVNILLSRFPKAAEDSGTQQYKRAVSLVFHTAAAHAKVEIVQKMIADMVSQPLLADILNSGGPNRESALWNAINEVNQPDAQLATVAALLEAGASTGCSVVDKVLPLDRACQFCHSRIVKALLDHGAEINKKGYSTLHASCFNGNHVVVCLLSKQCKDIINTRSPDRFPPLYYALLNEKFCTKIVDVLLNFMADPCMLIKCGEGASIPIIAAAMELQCTGAAALMLQDPKLSTRESLMEEWDGRTLLFYAVLSGDISIVESILLDRDMNLRGSGVEEAEWLEIIDDQEFPECFPSHKEYNVKELLTGATRRMEG